MYWNRIERSAMLNGISKTSTSKGSTRILAKYSPKSLRSIRNQNATSRPIDTIILIIQPQAILTIKNRLKVFFINYFIYNHCIKLLKQSTNENNIMNHKPNLFIVGAPKCGTTSLHHYLAQHPDIYMSTLKEMPFFCSDLIAESDKHHGSKKYFLTRYKEVYMKSFSQATNEKVLGESTVWNLYSKKAAKNIKKFNPQAKIIIMLREPVAAMYSLYAQLYPINENMKTFETALSKEEKRKKGQDIPKYTLFPSSLFYSSVFDYVPQIKRYYDLFPKKQIKIIILDDLQQNPEKVYGEVISFLGLRTKQLPDFSVKNPSHQTRFSFYEKWLANTPKWIKNTVVTLIPMKYCEKILTFFYNLNKRKKEKTPLPTLLQKRLQKQEYKRVVALGKLLKRDLLTLWKYEK